ncbi:MAG: hypothetical protein E6Z06_02910 [Clostridiales bacterium]|nr:hypothetical protein [Clostridiales bacterium]
MNNDYRDYLQHHGVKGMKWGVRKKYEKSSIRREYDNKKYNMRSKRMKSMNAFLDSASATDEADKYLEQYPLHAYFGKKAGVKGRTYLKLRDEERKAEDRYHNANLKYRNARKEFKRTAKKRRNEIRKTNKKIRSSSKLKISTPITKKTAKYIVDNNMSIQDAKKRAIRNSAVQSTAIILAGVGGMAAAKYTR